VTSLAAIGVSAPEVKDAARAAVTCFARVFEADGAMATPAQTARLTA